jgi:hypothetical protein
VTGWLDTAGVDGSDYSAIGGIHSTGSLLNNGSTGMLGECSIGMGHANAAA